MASSNAKPRPDLDELNKKTWGFATSWNNRYHPFVETKTSTENPKFQPPNEFKDGH